MIKCIIIDDETYAINLIKKFCDDIPYLEVIGAFTDALEAVSLIQDAQPDIIFLDINMQTISGIDFIKMYQVQNVILITAYSQYALDSYEYGVIDYLLKPVAFDRFLAATQKVLNKKRRMITERVLPEKVKEKSFFYIKTDRDKTVKINTSEIKYIEGMKNYICIHTPTESIMTLLNMKNIEEELSQDQFVRVQKSFIINLDYFESMEGNLIRLIDSDMKIPLGNTYKPNFVNLLNKNMIR